MPHKERAFAQNLADRLKEDPEFAGQFLEALSDAPLSIQLSLWRTLKKIPQLKISKDLGIQQAHLSRMEHEKTPGRIVLYQKMARLLGARIGIIPREAKIVWKHPRIP